MNVQVKAIGWVRTDVEEVPRHWSVSDVQGLLVIDTEYVEGLAGVEAGKRIMVIFNFHRSPGFTAAFLRQTPPHTGTPTGIFNACSPVCPNPIGMSVPEVLAVEG